VRALAASDAAHGQPPENFLPNSFDKSSPTGAPRACCSLSSVVCIDHPEGINLLASVLLRNY
jgi:hypothetical protein